MSVDQCTITVYFEDPFWVGLYERRELEGYQACKFTFGAEPKDHEVYQFLLCRWGKLEFSPFLSPGKKPEKHPNPKRARRQSRQSMAEAPMGTKAQEALKLQRSAGKSAARERSRQEREAEDERMFQLRQEKKRQKHRGR